ncbi:MAG: LytTR family DNA-binding domain-containing protein [Propionibacteriaceae bacterium]|jgi:DNA-binding LytR/AlgR family response regulator|nr:LytTR family DNA-binding domain-containing protein [Propionibacteriaceae bacterium]
MAHNGGVRIAIVEDSVLELDALANYLEGYCSDRGIAAEIALFTTGEALLEAASGRDFDLLFLDIFLPGISGVELARHLRERDQNALIIFTTVSPDFQSEGFDVWASGYIVKPATPEKLARAMHACRFLLERASRVVKIPDSGGADIQVPAADLVYAEVYYKRTVLHTTRGEFTTRVPLTLLEERLGGTPFLRCNRSFIVNMSHVDDVLSDDLLMRNGDRVPIRQRGRREVKLALTRFIAGSAAGVG